MGILEGPVRQPALMTQVADLLREQIRTGTWPVGMRIPGENQLATDLGVSRGTIREALRALSTTGLLEPRVGDGTYVRATDEIAGMLVRDDQADLLQVLDARAGLEAAAARLAALRDDPIAVAGVAAALAARTVAHETGELAAYVEADLAFHRSVVEASGNPVLMRLHDALAEVAAHSIEQTATVPEANDLRDAHHNLYQAIAAADPVAATSAAYAIIDAVKA